MSSTINAATSGGLISTGDTSGQLQLQTAGTTALTVDSSQNVGVGTASPAKKLDVSGTGRFTGELALGNDLNQTIDAYVYSSNGGGVRAGFFLDGTNQVVRVYTAATERMRITNAGNLTFSTSNAGIVFNNSSALTNSTLNDYETGTFTPSLSTGFTVTSGSFASTSIYTKIGNIVHFTIFQTSGTITFTQGSVITGLPFSPAITCTSGSYTNGSPNVQGGVLIYSSGAVIYMSSAQATQTSLVITGSYKATF